MKEKELVRFGVSMPQELVEQFDRVIAEQGYGNRSATRGTCRSGWTP